MSPLDQISDGVVTALHGLPLAPLAGLLVFRSLPFAVWAAFGMRGRAGARVALLALPCLFFALRRHLDDDYLGSLVPTLTGLFYYTLLAVGLHRAAQLARPPAIVAFALTTLAFLIVPVWMFPRGSPALALMIALGWELSLAAYSYHREASRERDTSLSGCLFFLLVNPELVFPSRSVPCAGQLWRGLGRFAWGACVMLVSMVLSRTLFQAPHAVDAASIGAGFVRGAQTLALLYAAHSALAHVQIGLCLVAGRRVPERYAYPLVARSPADFWARWNRYVGSWLRIYVYGPAFRASRARLGLAASQWVATLAAFVAVGLMHDGCVLLRTGEPSLRLTAGFVVWALLLVGARHFDARRLAGGVAVAFDGAARRALLLPLLCLSLWLFY